jgi:hypothetical protein
MAVGLPMGKLGRFWINFLFFCRISNRSLMVADGGVNRYDGSGGE